MKKIYTTLLSLLVPMMMMGQNITGWPANYGGVMLQGFYWDSYSDSQWTKLTNQADELAATFDLIWIPQSGNCGGQSMGYDDLYWFPGGNNYASSFGTEHELRTIISTFKDKWNWHKLSTNTRVKLSYELLDKFADLWDWEEIIGHADDYSFDEDWKIFDGRGIDFYERYKDRIPAAKVQSSNLWREIVSQQKKQLMEELTV